jgi:acetolactate synthase-1/2/3 large subunit
VLFDAGNCAAAALHYLRIPKHVSTTVALGMGGMGYAVAAAVGAQLGSRRGSQTMVFCGDGAFLMLGTEVHTAVHYQLPILFVVFNNGMHGMCVTRQQLYFDGRLEASRYPAISVAATARGLGSPDRLWVGSAATTEELSRCLGEYQAHREGPGVLELCLGREEIPPFTPFLALDAPTYEVAPFVVV